MNSKIMIDRVKTGERIRVLIASSGSTYEQIADLLELASPRVIYEWINGVKLPSLVNFLNLSIYLNIKIEDLLIC